MQRDSHGGDSTQTRRGTKDGRASLTVRVLDGDEQAIWLQCFSSAIAGSCAAQRTRPNQNAIIEMAAELADLALEEARARHRVRNMS